MAFVKFHALRTTGAGRGCALLLSLALAACAGDLSTLQPAGPAASRVAELWWVMLAGAMTILTGVVAVALYSLKADRRGRGLSTRRMLIGWGLIFPFATLTALMGIAFLRGDQLLARPGQGILEIRATAEQWAWTFDYPGGLRTRNELHVPAGEPFQVRVGSTDVIHSFWVPRLGGKIDAIPGRENVIALRADQPGRYRALCAEYCGIGHAHMIFDVHAHPPGEYEAALGAAREKAAADPGIVNQRRRPVSAAFDEAVDYLLRWVGIR